MHQVHAAILMWNSGHAAWEYKDDRISTNTYKTTPTYIIACGYNIYINQNIGLCVHKNIIYASWFYQWLYWVLLKQLWWLHRRLVRFIERPPATIAFTQICDPIGDIWYGWCKYLEITPIPWYIDGII